MNKGRVILAGGSGFLGHALSGHLLSAGYDVVILSRSAGVSDGVRKVEWDGRTVGAWASELEGAAAVINLAGESIARHWSKDAKTRILESRVRGAEAISAAISQCNEKPGVWVNASATGYYGDRGAEELDESSPPGKRGDFLVDTCVAWEARASETTIRNVQIRIGLVLGVGGGVFEPLYGLTRFFLGGPAGSGEQYMSWIHIDDLARLFVACVGNPSFAGPVCGTAPSPVTNRFFMATLRALMNRPWAPPAPAFVLRLVDAIGGPPAGLLLEGQRVQPRKAMENGFAFTYPDLSAALSDLIARKRRA
jgi:uncharacterized protein